MADDDLPIEVAEDPNYPRSKPLEKVSGQPTGAITGIKSVSPFTPPPLVKAGQLPDATPKGPGLWDRLNTKPDGPDPVGQLAAGAKQIPGIWNRIQNDPQGAWDSAVRGATKGWDAGTGPIASTTGDEGGRVGGEAAPLGVKDTARPDWDGSAAVKKQPPILFRPHTADAKDEGQVGGEAAPMDITNSTSPTNPAGTAVVRDDKASSEAKTGGGGVATPPEPIAATPTLSEEKNPPGLFGVPGLLGKFGENINNWRNQNRMQLLALAGGLAGAPSFGQGVGRGFTAMANSMPEQQKLNTQNSTVNYLMQKGGLDRDQAMAIMGNPQLAQKVLGQMSGLTPPDTTTMKIGEGQFKWVPGKGWQPLMGGGESGGDINAGNATFGNMSVPERLAHIEKMYPGTGTAEAVKAIGEYRDVAPNRLAALMPLAQKVYGEGLDHKIYDQARKTIMDFSPNGTSGKNITAIGTGIGHANDMVGYADALKNFTIGDKYTNAPYNAFRQFFNVDDFQRKVANFKATALGTSGEMAKAFRAAGMSENDIQGWLKMFSENSSPETIHGAAQAAMHMLNVRLDEIARSYNQAMPPNAQQKTGESFLTPNNIAVRNRIMGGPQTQTPPQTQATAGAQQTAAAAGNSGKPPIIIQNGHTYELQPDGRYK